jgi:hypothetical protein
LVEVLASLLFMAIVIPTAVQGLRIANLAGQVGHRKAAAAQVAERVLNDAVITGQWQSGANRGTVQDESAEYRWSIRAEPWNQHRSMRLLTVEVMFPIQGQEYEVRLSTIVDSAL